MASEINSAFLLPGEYLISKQPHIISTLLGSCVAVCLHNPQHKIGAMNHYMLPKSLKAERSGKYGDYSINLMLQFMSQATGSLKGTQAMVFGGANVLPNISTGQQIGERNILLAKEILQQHQVPIIKEKTGGTSGLKINFQTWDNQISVSPIDQHKMSNTLIAKEENTRVISKTGSSTDINRKIKVLVVDDSAIVRNILVKVIESESDMEVVGAARDAFEAREMLLERGPDVVTLDIIMPKMDGVTFLKKLMVYYPIPVIICSTIAKTGSQAELRSEQIGAVDIIDKENLNLYDGLDSVKKILLPKIRNAAKQSVNKKSKEDVASI